MTKNSDVAQEKESRLSHLRNLAQLSDEDVARVLDMNINKYRQIESSGNLDNLSSFDLSLLAATLGVTTEYLLDLTDDIRDISLTPNNKAMIMKIVATLKLDSTSEEFPLIVKWIEIVVKSIKEKTTLEYPEFLLNSDYGKRNRDKIISATDMFNLKGKVD